MLSTPGPLCEVRTTVSGVPLGLATLGGKPRAVEDARRRAADLIANWDPDRSGSDLRRLVSRPGVAVGVAPETVLLVALATSGDAAREVFTDSRRGLVGVQPRHLPAVLGLRGAVLADLLITDLTAAGTAGALADVGGDVRVAGASPEPGGWPVDVAAPSDGRVRLTHGAVAHAEAGEWGVFVVGEYAWEAKRLAGSVLAGRPWDAVRRLRAARCSGLLVARGVAVAVGRWPALPA
ncbi:MAG TPA: hypothetical protein VGD11_06375 [Mycobacteriales bacterium]